MCHHPFNLFCSITNGWGLKKSKKRDTRIILMSHSVQRFIVCLYPQSQSTGGKVGNSSSSPPSKGVTIFFILSGISE